MKYLQRLAKFIDNNDEQQNKDYYNVVIQRLEANTKKVDRISLYMVIVIIGYYMCDVQAIEEINIGPFALNNMNIIKITAPAVFSYLLFQYLLIGQNIGELTFAVKLLFAIIYKTNLNRDELMNSAVVNPITKNILPFSLWTILTNMEYGKLGSTLLSLSWILVIGFPFYFLYNSFKYCYCFEGLGKLRVASLIIAGWFTLCALYMIGILFITVAKYIKGEYKYYSER
ncbi:MAG: hypothetical protein ACK4EY_01765 [Flavipsychrobacter sp.]